MGKGAGRPGFPRAQPRRHSVRKKLHLTQFHGEARCQVNPYADSHRYHAHASFLDFIALDSQIHFSGETSLELVEYAMNTFTALAER